MNALTVIETDTTALKGTDILPEFFCLDSVHLNVCCHPLNMQAGPCRESTLFPQAFIVTGAAIPRDDPDWSCLEMILKVIKEGNQSE